MLAALPLSATHHALPAQWTTRLGHHRALSRGAVALEIDYDPIMSPVQLVRSGVTLIESRVPMITGRDIVVLNLIAAGVLFLLCFLAGLAARSAG